MTIEAMKQALEALEQLQGGCTDSDDGTVEAITVWCPEVITALRAAIEQAEKQEPGPVAFNHAIGSDRFKVVRGAFWWHVLIGDSPTEHGKFRSRTSAEKMAADLLREFRNGAFVQHTSPRQWQGLTDEEIYDCLQERNREKPSKLVRMIAKAIEEKLMEKNG